MKRTIRFIVEFIVGFIVRFIVRFIIRFIVRFMIRFIIGFIIDSQLGSSLPPVIDIQSDSKPSTSNQIQDFQQPIRFKTPNIQSNDSTYLNSPSKVRWRFEGGGVEKKEIGKGKMAERKWN